MQEHREQLQLHAAAAESAKASNEIRQAIYDHFCETFDRETMSRATLSVMVSYVQQYGPEEVYQWFEIARNRLGVRASDSKIGKYISGIRRNIHPEDACR
jgi:hypothetical protein